jgi:putative flippase GtrA
VIRFIGEKLTQTWDRRDAILRFGLGGLVSVGTAVSVSTWSHEVWGVNQAIAGANGFFAALAVNFIALRWFVFPNSAARIRHQLLRYVTVNGALRGGEYLAYLLLIQILSLHYQISMIIVMVVSSLMKFVIYDKIVFSRTRGKQA